MLILLEVVMVMVQEREAKRAKLKSENASAYIQQDTSAGHAGQANPITAVGHAKLAASGRNKHGFWPSVSMQNCPDVKRWSV